MTTNLVPNTNSVESSYIVTPEAVATAGSISYWRLSGAVDLAQLTAEWCKRGLDAKLLPKPVSEDVAFARAVRELAEKRRLVRPLAKHGAWAIVEEKVVGDVLEHTTMLTVKWDNAAPRYETAAGPEGTLAASSLIDKISRAHGAHRLSLEPEDIGTWLVKLAYGFSGVALRDTGGIYFVPRQHTETWGKIVAAVQACSTHRVFRIPAMKNSEAVDAITDAVTQEAEAIVRQMETELQAPDGKKLGEKALKTRAKACEALLQKVAAYDNLLGVQLKCRDRVEELSAAIAMAALVAGDEETA